MPLFRKPDPAKAPAAAEIYFFAGSDFMPGEATVVWHGDPELLVHGHAIYLDWAVNKDLRSKAVPFLEATRGFFEAPRERTVDYAANPHTALYALLPRSPRTRGTP